MDTPEETSAIVVVFAGDSQLRTLEWHELTLWEKVKVAPRVAWRWLRGRFKP